MNIEIPKSLINISSSALNNSNNNLIIYCEQNSIAETFAKNNNYSMYDEIVLFFNFCRQIQLLKELPTKYKYVLNTVRSSLKDIPTNVSSKVNESIYNLISSMTSLY